MGMLHQTQLAVRTQHDVNLLKFANFCRCHESSYHACCVLQKKYGLLLNLNCSNFQKAFFAVQNMGFY